MERPFDRVALLILDGVGCGEAPDAKAEFAHDVGANSLKHAANVYPLNAHPLLNMGLGYIPGLEGMNVLDWPRQSDMRGAYGALRPTHAGNGSPEGHQALMGLKVTDPFLYFTDTGIPDEVAREIERVAAEVIGRQVVSARYPGTDNVSGTVFIDHPDIGQRIWASRDTNGPAVIGPYASSDSLVQIAMHQDVTPQPLIKEIGKRVRQEVLIGKYGRVGRVIMRPFIGEPGNFKRVDADRVDFSLSPDGPTLIDHLTEAGVAVSGLGKTGEMFNDQGFPAGSVEKMESDMARMNAVLAWMSNPEHAGLLLANLKYTDEKFGHRRLPREYVLHIIEIAERIRLIRNAMTERDLLIITSDHGNDPTHIVCTDFPERAHTNHTRENVPILADSPRIKGLVELGVRKTFEDVAATIAKNFGVAHRLNHGESFLRNLY
jgi:phosphopentomutase